MRTISALVLVLASVAIFCLLPRFEATSPNLVFPGEWQIAGDVEEQGDELQVHTGTAHQRLRVTPGETLRLTAQVDVPPGTRARLFLIQAGPAHRWDLAWKGFSTSGNHHTHLTPMLAEVIVRAQMQAGEGPLIIKAAEVHTVQESALFTAFRWIVGMGWFALGGWTALSLIRRRSRVLASGVLLWATAMLVLSLAPTAVRLPDIELPKPVSPSAVEAPRPADPSPVPPIVDQPAPTPEPPIQPPPAKTAPIAKPPPIPHIWSWGNDTLQTVGHFGSFLVLAVLLLFLAEPKRPLTPSEGQFFKPLLNGALFGVAIEITQLWTTDRAASAKDVVVDVLGIGVAGVIYLLIRHRWR